VFAQVAIAHEVIRIVDGFMKTGVAPHCVNRLARSSATHVLSVRHQNKPGVLAHIFRILSEGQVNVEEVENIAYHGAQAACVRIQVSSPPSESALEAIRKGNENVISADLTAIE